MNHGQTSHECHSQDEEPDFKSMANHKGSQQDSGMTMIAVLLCTLVRGTKLQEGKVSQNCTPWSSFTVMELAEGASGTWMLKGGETCADVTEKSVQVSGMLLLQTRAVALLSRVAGMCEDDTRLQRVVPYILVS